LGSWPAVESARELRQVGIVVRGAAGDELAEGHARAGRHESAAPPLLGRQRAQKAERLAASPPERVERRDRVVPEVLPLLRPALRIEMADDFLGRPGLGFGPPR